ARDKLPPPKGNTREVFKRKGRAPAPSPSSSIYPGQAQPNVIPVSEPGSKETSAIMRRVGVSPGYPPVGAAHCAPARTLRLPHAMFARLQRFGTNWSGFQPKGFEKSIENRAHVKM
ncbi:MAG: hypothetical protein LBR60_01365, partial [Fibrobacter sp.]|nr:hypothetical protein [Fibrobacter sp.]